MQRFLLVWLIVVVLPWFGCAGPDAENPTAGETEAEIQAEDGSAAEERASGGPGGRSMAASPLGTPKDVIAHQYVLLRAGRNDELRELFLPEVREQMTDELLEELRANMQPVSINQLVDQVVEEDVDGRMMITIKARDGRTLTRLVPHGSTFQADTVWFK